MRVARETILNFGGLQFEHEVDFLYLLGKWDQKLPEKVAKRRRAYTRSADNSVLLLAVRYSA